MKSEKIKSFEDLIVWQKSKSLFITLNNLLEDFKQFFLRDQMLRAALSVSNNIAEGFERRSQKEFVQYLFIAKGSCGEVRSMLYILLEVRAIQQEQFNDLMENVLSISKMLMSLIQKVSAK